MKEHTKSALLACLVFAGILLALGLGVWFAQSQPAVFAPPAPQVPVNTTTITQITTNTLFQTFIQTNIWNTFNATTITTTTINVKGQATFNNIIVTNGMALITQTWLGPTNSLAFSAGGVQTNDYFYASFTACSITNFSLGTNLTEWSSITYSNAATTNFLVGLPASVRLAPGLTNQITLTNGTMVDIALKHDALVYTNGLYQFF